MYRFPPHLLTVAVASAISVSTQAAEPVDQDKVVVTAAGFEQNIMDAPASISVISGRTGKEVI